MAKTVILNDTTVLELTGGSITGDLSVAQPYLIPTSLNTTMQVSASDLFNGTAKKGPSWAVAGSAATLNSSAYPGPNVGPLNSKGYAVAYNLSPANVSAGPFTFVLLFNPSATDVGILFSTGTLNIDGLYCYETSLVINHFGGYVQTSVGNTPVNSALNVLIGGMDASGNTFLQLNGGTTATNTGATITPTVADNTTLGYYTGGGEFTTLTNLYEFRFSTDVPSSGAFTTLYNQIVSNITANTETAGLDITGPVTTTHSLAGGPTPSVGSFAGTSTTYWGTTSSVSLAGGDAAGKIQFTTGSTTTAIPANTPLFTVSLANGYSSSSYAAIPTLAQVGLSTPTYAIPDSNNTVEHVNADNLYGSTARIGVAWTPVGPPVLNSGGFVQQDSVGPFSSGGNWYTLSSSNPVNIAAPPFMAAFLVTPTSVANNPVFFYTGVDSTNTGYSVQIDSAGTLSLNIGVYSAVTSNTTTNGVKQIVIVGQDSTGKLFAQLNGGTIATVSGVGITVSSDTSSIGVYWNSGTPVLPFNGTISEFMMSTDVPTTTSITNLYNQIFANLSPQVSSFYAVPATPGSFVVYNTNQFTPNPSTVYNFQFMTFGAGAQY